MINPQYLLLFALLMVSSASHANLIFSEYVEGSSYNKALEIFNTGTTVDFDSGDYVVEIYSNGASESSYAINLSGVLAQNSTFVIGHSSAGAAISSSANLLTGSLNFNGDDAIRLVANGQTLDRIGQLGVDPGSEWGTGLLSTQNNTLRRQANILSGDMNALSDFDPSMQWLGFDNDVFAGLGTHDVDSPVQLPVQITQPSVAAPEPASVLLLLLGLLALLINRSQFNQFLSMHRENLC